MRRDRPSGSSDGNTHKKSNTLLLRLLTWLLLRSKRAICLRRDRPAGSSSGNADRRNKRAISATADIATTHGTRERFGCAGIVRRDRLAEMLTGETNALIPKDFVANQVFFVDVSI